MLQRILILTMYLSLTAITGIQKLAGNFLPEWFVQKFQHTLIHFFPGSLFLSYVLIVGLELFAAICFLLALIKREFKAEKSSLFTRLGFNTSLLLFTVLFFGSFIAQDYENGFMDMGYFVFTVFLQKKSASEKANESK